MLVETPVVLFIVAALTAIVLLLLMVLLNQTQKKSSNSNNASKNLENLRKYLLVDPVTSAYNQAFLAKKIEEELYRSARYNAQFTMAIFDFSKLLEKLDDDTSVSVFRKNVISAVRDTRYSDFVATLDDFKLAVLFTMTQRSSSEVPINRLLHKFEEVLKQDGIDKTPELKVLSFPEDKADIEKLIKELKE
ncbi:MAG: hypothetical protein N2440_02815 [Actinobacteria bacterium]|nr:hypothetical protein [Actinomycetota bacterium]